MTFDERGKSESLTRPPLHHLGCTNALWSNMSGVLGDLGSGQLDRV
jgi:hypothetical protein